MERQGMLRAGKRLLIVLLLLIGTSVIGVWLLRGHFPDTLLSELARAFLQLGSVAVVGAVITLLINNYQQEHQKYEKEQDLHRQQREKARELARQEYDKARDLEREENNRTQELYRKALEYREDLLKSTLAQAMTAYCTAKKARRLLRAQAVVGESRANQMVLAAPYDRCLEMVNDAQISLENLVRDIQSSDRAFGNPLTLTTKLRCMEGYLADLIGEYERNRPLFQGEEPSLPLAKLPHLQDFISRKVKADLADGEGCGEECRFDTELVHPYHDVQTGIRADLLHPALSDYLMWRTAPRTAIASPSQTQPNSASSIIQEGSVT